jgi:hypothetical protein
MFSNNVSKMIEDGKNIINENPFYFTLHLLIKYYFNKNGEPFMIHFIKDITKSEDEFKVFMIYINYCLYIYKTEITKEYIDNYEDLVYILISKIKKNYDNNRTVLEPFIKNITENEYEIIEKFNMAKAIYNYKQEALEKFNTINEALFYLEKSNEYKRESEKYSNMAIEILNKLKFEFKKNIDNSSIDSGKLILN